MEIITVLLFLGILVGVELVYYRKHALDELDLKVKFSRDIAEHGDTIEVIEVAQNGKRLPLPFILLKFETPLVLEFQDMTNTSVSDLLYREDMLTMKPFSRHTRKIKAVCTQRGYFTFPRVTISTSDLLMLERMAKDVKNDSTLTILPERIPLEDLKPLLSITYSDRIVRRNLLTDPFAFSGIRDYLPTDPMKNVNWSASARTGELMVNTFASTSSREVKILLNLEYYNQKHSKSLLEKAISFAFSYMCFLTADGIPCEIISNGRDIESSEPVFTYKSASPSDDTQRGALLSRIDLDQDASSFSDIIKNGISTCADDQIVIISPKCDDQFVMLMTEFRSSHDSMVWARPSYKTSPVPELTSEIASNYLNMEVLGRD